MKAKTIKLSICCGFPVLDESVPLGTEYEIDPSRTATCTFICGGCGQSKKVVGVFVENRRGGKPGYMPMEIFDLNPRGGFAA